MIFYDLGRAVRPHRSRFAVLSVPRSSFRTRNWRQEQVRASPGSGAADILPGQGNLKDSEVSIRYCTDEYGQQRRRLCQVREVTAYSDCINAACLRRTRAVVHFMIASSLPVRSARNGAVFEDM